MLTEVKYTPGLERPFSVFMKGKMGWISIGSYPDESTAIAIAKLKSLQADLPYVIRFENGERVNKNESDV